MASMDWTHPPASPFQDFLGQEPIESLIKQACGRGFNQVKLGIILTRVRGPHLRKKNRGWRSLCSRWIGTSWNLPNVPGMFWTSPLIIHLVFLEFLCQSSPPMRLQREVHICRKWEWWWPGVGGFILNLGSRVPPKCIVILGGLTWCLPGP